MIRIKEEVPTERPAVTKDLRNAVTKAIRGAGPQFADNHAKLMEVVKFIGRPRIHETGAQKQAAYRARKKAAKNG